MVSRQRVLVVDGLSETEQVLKAVLEPRGMHVERVRAQSVSRDTADTALPAMLVLHSDSTTPDAQHAQAAWKSVPRVVIGDSTNPADVTQHEYRLPAPFQYSELILAIEGLLTAAENRNSPSAA